MIVNQGKQEMAELIKGTFTKIKIGDGADDTNMSQTSLDHLVAVTKTATVQRVGNTLIYTVTFTGSELSTDKVSELGIFHKDTDKLLTRVNFNGIGPLSASESLSFTFRLEVE